MKKPFMMLTILLAGLIGSAGANSIIISANKPQYNYVWQYPSWGLIEQEVYGSTQNSWTDAWMYTYNGWGWFDGESERTFSNGTYDYGYVGGYLYDMSLNSKTDVLTGRFSGLDELYSYNSKTGYFSGWQYTYVPNALFVDNLNTGTFSITQTSAVPEPGSLLLFGTGLTGLAGLVRRKYIRR